jgi:hypothetical protein
VEKFYSSRSSHILGAIMYVRGALAKYCRSSKVSRRIFYGH